MKNNRLLFLSITGVMLLAAAWKGVFLLWDVVPFNADEAIVALMARHILQGARPVFFYGQAYMGSLDAYLVALGFAIFGQQVWVIRLVQALLYLATLLAVIAIGREAFGAARTGILAALLLSAPAVNGMLYTTASLGGYGEALLIGSLALLLALRLARRYIQPRGGAFPWLGFAAWGLLVGGGLWANGLSLVFSAPAGVYLLWFLWKYHREWLAGFVLAAGAGFLVGSLPWWGYALTHGFNSLVLELFGSAVSVETGGWLARTGSHLVNFLLLGATALFGFRPPWAVEWLALPLLPFALAFWLAVIWFFARQVLRPGPERSSYTLLAGVVGILSAGFLFTSFGVDPSGRYFVPLSIPLALVAARAVQTVSVRLPKPRLAMPLLIGLVMVYQMWGTLQCALRYPPGLTTQFYQPTSIDHRADQALIDFLRQHGETRGYSNYWVAYPLAFRSQEDILFAPRLPYHLDLRYTPRDDRYAPYTDAVRRSRRTAYITTNSPQLDAYLREHFSGLGITWEEQRIGDYQVYYRLSRAVYPQEIGLGDQRE